MTAGRKPGGTSWQTRLPDPPQQRDFCVACVIVSSAVAWCVVAMVVWIIVGALT